MSYLHKYLALVFMPFLLFPHGRNVTECVALDKTRPVQFISFEGVDRNAFVNGKGRIKGVTLRLTNNTNCPMLLVTPPGTAPKFVKKNGKYVKQNDYDNPELRNGSHVELVYRLYLRGQKQWSEPVSGGDVILWSKVNGGESVLFSVPMNAMKRGAEIELLFRNESDTKERSLRFLSSQIPAGVLK